jgi:serine/threonine protein kinase/tetratricopeptide (TPR) repeat protein
MKKTRGAAHFARGSGIEYRIPNARWLVMNEPERQIMSILGEAVEYRSPEERAAFVGKACAGDPDRQARVEALLRAYEAAGNFLQGDPLPRAPVATVDQADREQSGTLIGPYKLLERIGEGGMGTVWMAQQTEPVKRLVAVKLIKAGMDSRQVIARFGAERQALALMDHPNIAKVLDAGTTEAGRPYFVMDLVKGVPITRYCDEHHLTPRQRLELFIPVCQAVQHAHQKGVIHRDLKPSNVLVAVYDPGAPGVPKVIDFGVAKAAWPAFGGLTEQTLVTPLGNLVGTLEYMSPEQAEINQLDIDTRSDIYALGVLLYELLTGSPPFSRKELENAGMLEMLRIIREQDPSKPSTKLSTAEGLPTLAANRGTEPAKLTKLVRGELDWIVMKALEKDRNRRYETANAFAMDVQRYLADEPVLAGPPGVRYRLRKFLRRNRGPVLAGTLVVLALVAGVIGTTWGMLEARRRAQGERRAKERAQANFALANEAVEQYLGTVTSDPELKRADFHRLRKKLLESAIPFFQKLTGQKNNDPEVEAGRGRAYGRLGLVRHEMGEHDASFQDYEASRAIFARLTADFPAVPAYRHGLAMGFGDVGYSLHHLGKHTEAEAAFREGIAIGEKLAAEFPSQIKYRESLVNELNNVANLLDDLGKPEEAEALYRQAIALGEKLADEFPAVPAFRFHLAGSHNNLAVLLHGLGNQSEAESAQRRALDLRAKLAADFPTEPTYRDELAQSYVNLGNSLSLLGQREKAAAHFREAIAIQNRLAAEFPTVPRYRQTLATACSGLGSVLCALRQRDDADSAYRQAIAIRERLAAEFRMVPAYRQELAASHNNRGLALLSMGKRPEAEAAYRQAIVLQEGLAAEFPDVPAYAVGLGGGYCNFGNWVNRGGQPEAALGWFQKAIATLGPVVERASRLVDARRFLRNSHWGRATALDDLGRDAEATRDWERAWELDDGSYKATFRMRILRNKKDGAGCLAAAAEYEARKGTDAVALYDAACNRAVCAAVIPEDPRTHAADAARLAREQADLAMAWLHKAAAAGYKNAAQIKQDKDLDALREREDFKKLLAELQGEMNGR